MVPQIPAMKTAAGNSRSTDMPARLQNDWPWSTNPKIRLWNGTIHARPAITQANSCERMKLHCWVWAALVTASCIGRALPQKDRKSTRLNSSHGYISYAVFCLKKKKKNTQKGNI